MAMMPALAVLLGTSSGPAHAHTNEPNAPQTRSSAAIQQEVLRGGADSGWVTAGRGFNRCPSGYLCLFTDRRGGGHMAYFKWASPNLAHQHINNRTSSYWNRTHYNFRAYLGANYTGESMLLSPGGNGLDLNWGSYEDMISSVRSV
ncbi:peptidase inhibitor family I36 protein [Saccharomonospora saliphila]|uniref:peptidase inhibitor family I36 protein n=1 Tax=Saccharomonospora saliphila TaxID=369829 RepID=UPI0003819534|nr:peptidase inhibitor family I36 protein [Saccharomonospora saliphila]